MKKAWTQGLDEQEAEDVKGSYIAALVIRKRLKEILGQRIKTSRDSSFSKSGYDSPNWAYEQADSRGFERALNDVLQLLK